MCGPEVEVYLPYDSWSWRETVWRIDIVVAELRRNNVERFGRCRHSQVWLVELWPHPAPHIGYAVTPQVTEGNFPSTVPSCGSRHSINVPAPL